MRATQTQIDAFHAIPAAGLCATQQMVVDLFDGYRVTLTLTRQDIADRTNMRLSSVCGRVRELLDAGVLVVRGSRKCAATGCSNQTVGLPVDA